MCRVRNQRLRTPASFLVAVNGRKWGSYQAYNVFGTSLKELCEEYDPVAHPICGPLLTCGPVALVMEYALPHDQKCVDACHLCYEARRSLRERFPEVLRPDKMYGVAL